MKKRIIILTTIMILISSISLINYLNKNNEENLMQQEDEVVKSIRNENYDETTTTTTTTTTSTSTKKTTKKKTTKNIKMNVKATQQEMLDYTYTEVIRMGWSSSEYEIIVKLVSHESGWKPNNVNEKSGACGLFQAKPCSKVFKDFPDYATNYKSQIKWGLNYIKDRYGTPTKAWNFWQQHYWY